MSTKKPEAWITVMAHKPAGVFTKTWYSVTSAGVGNPFSRPFADAKDINRYVDEARERILSVNKNSEIKVEWIKETPDLAFTVPSEGTKDWQEIFKPKTA